MRPPKTGCRVRIAALLLSLMGTSALAQQGAPGTSAPLRPAPAAINAFWDYYFDAGGQGPLLADARLCLEVSESGEDKHRCVGEVPAEGVAAGTVIYVWQAYLVPRGDTYDDVQLQVKLGNQVRATKDIRLRGASIRTRAWSAVRLSRKGSWTLELRRGDAVLRTLTVEAL